MTCSPRTSGARSVQNYTQLYGTNSDYTNQLKALEAARTRDPKDPALRFLLGFHYGYLGYPKEAVRELGKAVELERRDPAARKLHDIFAAKIGASPVGPPPEMKPPEGAELNRKETRRAWSRTPPTTSEHRSPGPRNWPHRSTPDSAVRGSRGLTRSEFPGKLP